MASHRQPRSKDAAAQLCERYAVLAGEAAEIEAQRNERIAEANAAADAELVPAREEMAEIEAKLAPWWAKASAELTEGKRKSIELGGCIIGSRAGRASLAIAGEEQDVIDILSALRWAKPFLRVRTSLDRTATLKGLDGKHSKALAELGIERDEGEETFFVQRAEQGRTIGKS